MISVASVLSCKSGCRAQGADGPRRFGSHEGRFLHQIIEQREPCRENLRSALGSCGTPPGPGAIRSVRTSESWSQVKYESEPRHSLNATKADHWRAPIRCRANGYDIAVPCSLFSTQHWLGGGGRRRAAVSPDPLQYIPHRADDTRRTTSACANSHEPHALS